jgi:hypothetical protein
MQVAVRNSKTFIKLNRTGSYCVDWGHASVVHSPGSHVDFYSVNCIPLHFLF